jgi:hypothetical protein
VLLGVGNGRRKGGRHRLGDLILERENVGEIAIVVLGPDVISGASINKLRRDAHPITGLAHAAFEHIAHAEFPSDLLHIDRAALVGEAGVARDDEERGIPG